MAEGDKKQGKLDSVATAMQQIHEAVSGRDLWAELSDAEKAAVRDGKRPSGMSDEDFKLLERFLELVEFQVSVTPGIDFDRAAEEILEDEQGVTELVANLVSGFLAVHRAIDIPDAPFNESDLVDVLGGAFSAGISDRRSIFDEAWLGLGPEPLEPPRHTPERGLGGRIASQEELRKSESAYGAGASASVSPERSEPMSMSGSLWGRWRDSRSDEHHPLTGATGRVGPVEDRLVGVDPQAPGPDRLVGVDPQAPRPLYRQDEFHGSRTDTHPLTNAYGMTPGELDAVLGIDSAFIEARQSQGDFMIALDSSNRPVAYDDPNVARTVFYVDYLKQMNIDPTTAEGQRRAEELLRMTQWWDQNSSWTQNFQQDWFHAGDAQRAAMIESTINNVEQVLRDTGNVGRFSQSEVFEMARHIHELGLHFTDSDLRRSVLAYDEMNLEQSSTSAIAQSAFDFQSMARDYFMPLSDEAARDYAEQVYVGDVTSENLEMMFREQAMARFPSLAGYIHDGFTPQQYFGTYESEMERMLDRQVSIFDEFPDIIDHVPTVGGDRRPMTYGEMREFTRRLPEWKHSDQGQDAAKLFSYSLGQMFGEVA